MTVLHRVRRAARRVGLDVGRYPQETDDFRTALLLREHGVGVVLDVGAHTGGYGAGLRSHGYRGRIVSFEPVAEHHRRLAARAARDRAWTTRRLALGAAPGEAALHVAGNAGASSSLLPMLERHARAAPDSAYVRQERVEVGRLDAVWDEVVRPGERVFLKLDVQGFERQVLDGLGARVADCAGLQLEMSLVPLYAGGVLYRELLDWAEERGFALMNLLPGFADAGSGRMYQCDAVLMRE
ncbi:FkbM family methyltransferase [Streptomyces sp. NPDC059009]|uniref:FkbM family methyltransferase n=1 Tax=Streptomyces sp. NPDC059009 TaxID=3346694 RepID=UPI0036B435C3